MLLEIYKTMLETAQQNQGIPEFIEFGFYINKEKSKEFWTDKSLVKEHEMLFNEWDSYGPHKYNKTLYGVKFTIQFNQ